MTWTRTVEIDNDPPTYEPGHPWHGLAMRPAYVLDWWNGRLRKMAWRPDATKLLEEQERHGIHG